MLKLTFADSKSLCGQTEARHPNHSSRSRSARRRPVGLRPDPRLPDGGRGRHGFDGRNTRHRTRCRFVGNETFEFTFLNEVL